MGGTNGVAYFIAFTVSGELELLYTLGIKAPKLKTEKCPVYFGIWNSRA